MCIVTGRYVTQQLSEIGAFEARSMTVQAEETRRKMVECFPSWHAALELLSRD